MNAADLAALGSFVSGIAVLGSLVYLALQIRRRWRRDEVPEQSGTTRLPPGSNAFVEAEPERELMRFRSIPFVVALFVSQPVFAMSSQLPVPGAPDGCEWRLVPSRTDATKLELYCKSLGQWSLARTRPDFNEDTVGQAHAHKADALAALGEFYLHGPTNLQDIALTNPVKALGLFREAAAAGSAVAMRELGLMYTGSWPNALQADTAEAMRWYFKAADKGDGEAMSQIAAKYRTINSGVPLDYGEAFRWYQKAAAAGSASGMYGLAEMYFSGYGVKPDGAMAATWFRAAANAGLPSAKWMLGHMYLRGEGVPQDTSEGLRWLQADADEGDSSALLLLCQSYTYGWGVAKDPAAANAWCMKYRTIVAERNHIPESQVSTAPVVLAAPR